MSEGESAPAVMWEGKYVRAIKQGKWEYASRVGDVRAVVVLAEHDGKTILVEQPRVAVGGRCLELPAGLVGDEDPGATIEGTAVKELEEETGYTATRVERLGDFHASPGMLSESFTLVRAHGVSRSGEGGGTEHEDIEVHLVPRGDIPAFIAQKRSEGVAIDVKLLLFLGF
ncbi:MAG TPA: NUDIX hydrolase [Sphingomicrobium sp.]|nr:NUDIX hydrolase [Sphingomicrobium sp.]